jgi:hypothetical protein
MYIFKSTDSDSHVIRVGKSTFCTMDYLPRSQLQKPLYHLKMSRVATKSTQCICNYYGSRPACASVQSDQDPCCSLSVSRVGKPTAWILIRLGRCTCWSGSMLVANALCWFCRDAAQIVLEHHIKFRILVYTGQGT